MNKTRLLTSIGYSNYILTEEGKVYKIKPSQTEIKSDSINRFYLINDEGISKRETLKKLYRKAFDEEFSKDNIQNYPLEEWKYIKGTNKRYLISNYGRVKSLCGYIAKILIEYQQENGYLTVKINGKNRYIHKLVSEHFLINNYQNQPTETHHKDTDKNNNKVSNLQILTVEEHKKIHGKKENKDNENILS